MTTIIETERLILRTWRKEDADAYFQSNQDPKEDFGVKSVIL
jgi:RimJ/RimL family protein N-acetyltransferase